MAKEIDKALVAEARAALRRYMQRRRKAGEVVTVEESLYHKGLSNVRCVLKIDGVSYRLYYRQAEGRWEKVSR
jgi:hypothetical protein